MRFLIIFIFLSNLSFADELPNIKNLIIKGDLKKHDSLTFLDAQNKQINLNDYQGNLIILNFWATWCAPCKEEMPSLDALKANPNLDNLEIFPINIGKDNLDKSKIFFNDLNIKNLEIYFDNPKTLAKIFALRGVPTTILFNKQNQEFARIIGSTNFADEKFKKWLIEYN